MYIDSYVFFKVKLSKLKWTCNANLHKSVLAAAEYYDNDLHKLWEINEFSGLPEILNRVNQKM